MIKKFISKMTILAKIGARLLTFLTEVDFSAKVKVLVTFTRYIMRFPLRKLF